MQWAEDTYDDTIAFWIYFFVDKDEQGIVADKESKSLCYVPFGVGCFMPYEESSNQNHQSMHCQTLLQKRLVA